MTIQLVVGDICTFNGDVIVNAANNDGLGGGGVDGAIHRVAGPRLLAACKTLPTFPYLIAMSVCGQSPHPTRVPTGGAVPLPAFNLPSRWVILTAGPIWPEDPEKVIYVPNTPVSGLACKSYPADTLARAELRACYKMPMLTAVGMGCGSLAYPAISTGVYGCPVETCAEVALQFAHDYRDWPIDVSFYIHPAEHLATWLRVAESLDTLVKVIED